MRAPSAELEDNAVAAQHAPRGAFKLSDFDIIESLGEGSFSEVIQASLRSTNTVYALKIVDKKLALRHKKVENLRLERKLLDELDHPGIVAFYFSFQDQASIYFGLELCPNGELFEQIQRKGQLEVHDAKIYAAEIVDTLSYLRQKKVVHGDLKPENLLLTADGHLKLIDFGSAHDLSSQESLEGQRQDVLQGTADYTPPEMLEGKPPFRAGSEYLTFQRILALDHQIPSQWPSSAQSIIRMLLQPDPLSRLGKLYDPEKLAT